jgi:hypothetical protein
MQRTGTITIATLHHITTNNTTGTMASSLTRMRNYGVLCERETCIRSQQSAHDFDESLSRMGKYTTYTSVVLGKLARGVSTEVVTSNVARKNLGP